MLSKQNGKQFFCPSFTLQNHFMDRKEVAMFLSKRPNGIYHLYYDQADGKRTSVSTKTKLKSEAYKFLAEFSKNLKEQKERIILSISLKDFTNEFLKHSEVVHTYWTNHTYKQTFKFLNKYYPKKILIDVKARDINRYIEYRIKKASIYQARKDLINIAAAFNWAIVQGYLIENPCKNIKKIKVPQKLPLYYSPTDFEKLLNAITNEDIRDLVIFAVNTGMRQMELIRLQWDQISFEKNIVILDNQNHITKGKKVRTIPLNATALNVVEKRFKNRNSKIVFTLNGRILRQVYLSQVLGEYIEDAGINTKLNFHSLRHTFASRLVQKGVSIYEVSKLLGHADIKTTQIYAHLRSDDLRNAVELLN
jgi:site-specific recombinase XerD